MTDTAFSARRGRLASFENAYAVAVQRCEDTGADQYVIATGNPVQPFRVSRHEPAPTDTVYAMVA